MNQIIACLNARALFLGLDNIGSCAEKDAVAFRGSACKLAVDEKAGNFPNESDGVGLSSQGF